MQILTCPHCQTQNRLAHAPARNQKPVCGSCKQHLLPETPPPPPGRALSPDPFRKSFETTKRLTTISSALLGIGLFTPCMTMTPHMNTPVGDVMEFWKIPTENEWYKAAYYDPSLNSGTGGYWLYPTRSNTAPEASWANRNLPNEANIWTGASLTGSSNNLTPVGSFTNSASAYGTFDQGGNVRQWNDKIVSGSNRGERGGAWDLDTTYLTATYPYGYHDPTFGIDAIGFRVATVPEPTVTVSLIVGMGMLACRRRR